MSAPAPRLRTFVVEDELPTRNYLVELVQATNLADVVGAVAGIDEARQVLEASDHSVDAAFVDVQLVNGDAGGLDLVRALAGRLTSPLFVLATAYQEHAIEAFRLGVVDYLLKPFTEERVEQCVRRLLARRPVTSESTPLRIVARRGKTLVFLEHHEVWAFEAAERMASVHSLHGVFDLDLSLSAIEISLGRAFTRVHRNWLVNSSHIKELGREGNETRVFVGSGLGPDQRGVRVPVSRERAQALRDMLLASSTGVRRG